MRGELGELKRVSLREIWPGEARDFTPWLAEEGLELLSEELGLKLELVDSEVEVGQFRVDILAKTEGDKFVVIENQFGKANHGHLGKLLVYMSNLEAPLGVWIVEEAGAEHLKAVQWINENTSEGTGVYLVKVEAYKIGSSPPAPKFTLLEAPSLDAKALARDRQGLGEAERLRLRFWEGLLKKANELWPRHPHAGRSPQPEYDLGGKGGMTGVRYVYFIRKDGYAVALRLGPEAREVFDFLASRKGEIEEAFGESLVWRPGLQYPRVEVVREGLGLAQRDRWEEVWEAMVEDMRRLYQATQPLLKEFRKAQG